MGCCQKRNVNIKAGCCGCKGKNNNRQQVRPAIVPAVTKNNVGKGQSAKPKAG